MTFSFPRLSGKVTAALTAATIALTSLTAAPASAMTREERNALGLILGIGAVAVLADGTKDRRRTYAPEPVRPPMRFEHRERRYDDHRYYDRRADRCTVRIERDRHGRRIETYSRGCGESRGDRYSRH